MLQVSFDKVEGFHPLGVLFCWRLRVDGHSPTPLVEHLIPEFFYDFLFVKTGRLRLIDPTPGFDFPLRTLKLKTIHTKPITLMLSPPLELYGARLTMRFAESYWGGTLLGNTFIEENWITEPPPNIEAFRSEILATIQERRISRKVGPLLLPDLEETEWFSHYSPRHKRRLYKSIFGISKKELQSIQSLHAFLGQTCDFSKQNPRIIEYIDSEVFYDQPHLNRAFKKLTGLSPLEYLQGISVLQDNLMAASYNKDPE